MGKTIKYSYIEPLLKAPLNEKLILDNYDEILRVAGSLQMGFVTASLFISKLQARPQQNMLTRVLQEYTQLRKEGYQIGLAASVSQQNFGSNHHYPSWTRTVPPRFLSCISAISQIQLREPS